MNAEKKRALKRFIEKNIFVTWIVVAVLILSGMLAYGAYTSRQNKAKKVIATSADTKMRFSSNYLEEGDTRFKSIVKSESDPEIVVAIRNYSRINPTLWYSSDIVYDVSVRLTDAVGIAQEDENYASRIAGLLGNDSVTVQIGDTTLTLDKNTVSGSFEDQRLVYSRTASAEKTYTVTFPGIGSKICVEMIATPKSGYKDLKPISAYLSIADRENIQSEGWTGSFNDATANGKVPADYAAYNYVITGQGTTNAATFSWNASKLEVNRQYFLTNFGVDVTEVAADGNGWKTVTLTLDSTPTMVAGETVVRDRYDFQMFKVGPGVTFATWNALKEAVSFDDGIEE